MKYSYFMLFTLCGALLSAQGYTLTVSTDNTYTPLDADLADSLLGDTVWDDPEYTVAVNVDFNFYGLPLTELTNPGALGPAFFAARSPEEDPDRVIGLYFADLIDRAYRDDGQTVNLGEPGSLSPILQLTEGDPGSRIWKLEYRNAGYFSDVIGDAPSGDFVNVQLWLYEENGSVEIHFGPNQVTMDGDDPFDGLTGPQILLGAQLDVADEALDEIIQVVTGNPTDPVLIPATVENIDDGAGFALLGTPPAGTVYRFVPEFGLAADDFTELAAFTVAPNPSAGHFVLDATALTPDRQIARLEVISPTGRKVLQSPPTVTTLDLSAEPSGIYQLLVYLEDGTKSIRQLVKR